MTDSVKNGLKVGAGFLWVAAFGVGIYRDEQAFITFYRRVQRTEALSQDLHRDSVRIVESTRAIHERTRESDFLRGLVNLLPQSKSFIRTQRAMGDEVEVLRYKVSRYIRNDLHILVDTRANKLYVKKGLTLLWEADCSVGKGGILTDKVTGQKWEFVTPRGQFEVREKIESPLWTKPDWAFVEAGQKVPPPNDP